MSDAHSLISRRRFCAGACQVASCATVASVFAGCGGMASSPTGPSGPSATMLGVVAGRFAGTTVQVPVAGSALSDVGGAVLVESVAGMFLVSRTGPASVTAIDGICSHESCTIKIGRAHV